MTGVAAPLSSAPRVNLMPRSEVARRERDRHVRRWLWIVLGALLVALLIIAGALAFRFIADRRLAGAQSETGALLAEIASLSEVSEALAAESELTDFRAQATATDVAWAPVVGKITGILPAGTSLTGIDFTVGGAPQANPTTEQGLVGTVSFDSPTPLDIVPIIRSLRGVEGVLHADGQSVTRSEEGGGRFSYLLDVQFDQTVYSNRFATEQGSQ